MILPFVRRIFEEFLYLLELGFVLNRSHLGRGVQAIADDGGVGEFGQFCAHGFVQSIRHVDALDGEAYLAGVDHGAHEDLGGHFLDVDVIEHDGRVVAAELQASGA